MLNRLIAKPGNQPSYEDHFQKFLAWQEEAKILTDGELAAWIDANPDSDKLPAYTVEYSRRAPQALPVDTERYFR